MRGRAKLGRRRRLLRGMRSWGVEGLGELAWWLLLVSMFWRSCVRCHERLIVALLWMMAYQGWIWAEGCFGHEGISGRLKAGAFG